MLLNTQSGISHIHAVKTFVDVWSIHIKIKICIFLDRLILIEQPPMSELRECETRESKFTYRMLFSIFPIFLSLTLAYMNIVALFIDSSLYSHVFLLYILLLWSLRCSDVSLVYLDAYSILFINYEFDMISIQAWSYGFWSWLWFSKSRNFRFSNEIR